MAMCRARPLPRRRRPRNLSQSPNQSPKSLALRPRPRIPFGIRNPSRSVRRSAWGRLRALRHPPSKVARARRRLGQRRRRPDRHSKRHSPLSRFGRRRPRPDRYSKRRSPLSRSGRHRRRRRPLTKSSPLADCVFSTEPALQVAPLVREMSVRVRTVASGSVLTFASRFGRLSCECQIRSTRLPQ